MRKGGRYEKDSKGKMKRVAHTAPRPIQQASEASEPQAEAGKTAGTKTSKKD